MRILRTSLVTMAMLLTIGMLACKANKSGEQSAQTGNGNANAQVDMQPGGVSGGKASGGKVFRGSVGGNTVQLTLSREGDQLAGSYFYQKVGTEISLKGSINAQGDFTLQEFDSSGKQTGEFKGKWSEPADLPTAILEGTWSKPNSKDTLVFYAKQQIVEINNGLTITTKEIKEDNKKQKYAIKAEYPELAGAANPNAVKFNQEVKAIVTKEVNGFKGGVAENSDEGATSESGSGSDIQIGYDVILATNDLISVLFDVSSYSQGAAHPNSHSLVINFDLKTGRTLKLSELFTPNSNFLSSISSYAIGELKKQIGENANNEWIEGGAGPKVDNYLNWNISRKGLAITFDAYQVASYADGPKRVIVPYSTVKDVTKQDGPIGTINK